MNASKPVAVLRPFTPAEHAEFPGNGPRPLLARLPWCAVVLNPFAWKVQVYATGLEVEGERTVWAKSFACPVEAREAAEAILAANDPAAVQRLLDQVEE